MYSDPSSGARRPESTAVPGEHSEMGEAGLMIQVRPIRRTDIALLADAFSRLSPRSRELRFLLPKNELSLRELRYFTDVDHRDHEAFVAVSRLTGQGLGVARYVRHRDDPEAADVAVTVVDEWQGRGLGTALLKRLADSARCQGIRRFTALLAADNQAARRLLRRTGGTVRLLEWDGTSLSYDVTLPPAVGPATVIDEHTACA